MAHHLLLSPDPHRRNAQKVILTDVLAQLESHDRHTLLASDPFLSRVALGVRALYALTEWWSPKRFIPPQVDGLFEEGLPPYWSCFQQERATVSALESGKRHIQTFLQYDVLHFIISLALEVFDMVAPQNMTRTPPESPPPPSMSLTRGAGGRIYIPFSTPGCESTIIFTKYHIAVLLAGGILGVVRKADPRSQLRFSFDDVFFSSVGIRDQKIHCLSRYFVELKSLVFRDPDTARGLRNIDRMRELVRVTRHVNYNIPRGLPDISLTGRSPAIDSQVMQYLSTVWFTSTLPLADVEIYRNKLIQDCDTTLQADFGNRQIGGGVLRGGGVQEEIFFLTYPELLVTLLVTQPLDQNEVIMVEGAERFCDHTGYSNTFRCLPLQRSHSGTHGGRFGETPLHPRNGCRDTTVVVMDALNVAREPSTQYEVRNIARELMKVTAAMSVTPDEDYVGRKAFATGNWGCGAFRGDPKLKFVIQWLGASFGSRKMMYCTFNHPDLVGIEEFMATMRHLCPCVGDLAKCLVYCRKPTSINPCFWMNLINYARSTAQML